MMPYDDEPTIYELTEPPPEADRWAKAVIGAAIEVHRHLGPGHLEEVYQRAMEIELTERQIPFVPQAPVQLKYKGHLVGEGRMDFLVAGILVVEIKAVSALVAIHKVQAESYLASTGLQLALLLNFNTFKLKDGGIMRVIHSR